jgi:ribonuclease E
LHVTDLHPKYFPGKETSERVGKKIAKHNRPPIQRCLKRGDEVLVQVLKEGIGTKGPTLTSYLSIPGRLAVMMPFMDKVGVSRKIEDESERRDMRKILDSLNLPEGFGFILRTAGMGKKKPEIKRDIAYLLRLWKMIEKRIDTIGAPCQLYNESDLLVRTIRDVMRPCIGAIVVDSDSSYERISTFLKILSF